MPENFFKKTWKLLTEDPSKDASKSENDEVTKLLDSHAKTVFGKEDKPKVLGKSDVDAKKYTPKKKTFLEKLIDLRSGLNSTTSDPDLSITNIKPYHENYGYYSSSYAENRKLIVTVRSSGRRMFERLVPDFGLSERQTMGRMGNPDFTSGILKTDVGTHTHTHTQKIRHISFDVVIEDENWANRGYEFQDHYRCSLKSIVVNRSEISDITKFRDISINVPRHTHSSTTNLSDFLKVFNSKIESLIVSEFKESVRKFEQEKELTMIMEEFNKNLDKETIVDLFTYISDEVGDRINIKKTRSDKNQNGRYHPIIDQYWEISIGVDTINHKMNMNGNLPKIFIEVGEAIGRIKEIHNNCDIDLSFTDNRLVLNIKPIFPKWKSDVEKSKERATQALGRLNRNGYDQWMLLND